MNGIFRLRKGMPVTSVIPIKHIVYMALLSDMTTEDLEGDKFAVSALVISDVYDRFPDWTEEELLEVLDELGRDGLLEFYDTKILLGEFRGRKFFPFEVKSSLFDRAIEFLQDKLGDYASYSRNKSRAKYIKREVKAMTEKVDKLCPNDFTELHGLLYEVYTGGEVYNIRNQVEYYQTSNILKAYDRHTTFAIIVEGTLNFDAYRKKGVPTLTLIGVMKDEVFGALTKGVSHGKDYMRSEEEVISGGF